MLKQVIVVRKDLKLSKGKLATQVGHATVLGFKKSEYKRQWEKEGQKKIVLWCNDLEELMLLYKKARKRNLPVIIIEDAGLTQIQKGTKTCIAIGPAPEDKINKITGKLKLI